MSEPKHFIQKAIKHPGALHRDLGVKEGHKIPHEKILEASHEGGKTGQRARFALILAKIRDK